MNNTYKRLLGLVVNNRNDEETANSQSNELPAKNKERERANTTLGLLNLSPADQKRRRHEAEVRKLRYR